MDRRELQLRKSACRKCRRGIRRVDLLGEASLHQTEVWQIKCLVWEQSDHQSYAEYAVFLTKETPNLIGDALAAARPHFEANCFCRAEIKYNRRKPIRLDYIETNTWDEAFILQAECSRNHPHQRVVVYYLDPPQDVPDRLPADLVAATNPGRNER